MAVAKERIVRILESRVLGQKLPISLRWICGETGMSPQDVELVLEEWLGSHQEAHGLVALYAVSGQDAKGNHSIVLAGSKEIERVIKQFEKCIGKRIFSLSTRTDDENQHQRMHIDLDQQRRKHMEAAKSPSDLALHSAIKIDGNIAFKTGSDRSGPVSEEHVREVASKSELVQKAEIEPSSKKVPVSKAKKSKNVKKRPNPSKGKNETKKVCKESERMEEDLPADFTEESPSSYQEQIDEEISHAPVESSYTESTKTDYERKQVSERYLDENGYMVTRFKYEDVPVEKSKSSEELPQKRKSQISSKNTKQRKLSSFFKKKD